MSKKDKEQVEGDEAHEGMKKPPEDVLRDLDERGLWPLVAEVAMKYGCTPGELCSYSKQKPIPEAKATLWARLRDDYGWSPSRTGEIFGVDQSSVNFSLKNSKKYETRKKP